MADTVELIVNTVMPLAAAFLGAHLAFRSERKKRIDDDRGEQIATIHNSLAHILWARNAVYTLRTQVLDPVREHPYRYIAAGARLKADEPLPLDLAASAFPHSAEVMNALFQAKSAVESARVAVRMLNSYSEWHAHKYQPELALRPQIFGDRQQVDPREIVAVMPHHVIAGMQRIFDEFVNATDSARKKLIEVQYQLRNAAKTLFPHEKFMVASIPEDRAIEEEVSVRFGVVEATPESSVKGWLNYLNPAMTKNVVIAVLLILAAYQTSVITRIENQRYAMTTGACKPNPITAKWDVDCLAKVQTREGWWWHVIYAMKES